MLALSFLINLPVVLAEFTTEFLAVNELAFAPLVDWIAVTSEFSSECGVVIGIGEMALSECSGGSFRLYSSDRV